eukprot:TRINITY_DN71365_c0_g1_i1.p1 TRINITY_DN71365_c0_g1~~TRINITY_DN71365_c0_g1_i1.p1  ORF type:complete len:230 (-),score=60.80 TRINITY_DN71365_c0_g1_i1:321-1010(-)
MAMRVDTSEADATTAAAAAAGAAAGGAPANRSQPATDCELLRQLRTKIDQELDKSRSWRTARDVEEENLRLNGELREALRELEKGDVAARMEVEAQHWGHEFGRLEIRKREMDAATAAQRDCEAAQAEAMAVEVAGELRRQESAVEELGARCAALFEEEALCQAALHESQQQAADMAQRRERQAAFGVAGGGIAHVFVAALPSLDRAAILRAREAVDAQLHRIQLTGSP